MPDYRQRSEAKARKALRQKLQEKRWASRAANERLRERRRSRRAWQAWAVVLVAAVVLGLALYLHH